MTFVLYSNIFHLYIELTGLAEREVQYVITSNFPTRAREIVGFAGSGQIFETEDRFISRQEAKNRSIKLCISQDFEIHRLTLSPVRIVHT